MRLVIEQVPCGDCEGTGDMGGHECPSCVDGMTWPADVVRILGNIKAYGTSADYATRKQLDVLSRAQEGDKP